MLANGFDLVFPQFYRLGKTLKRPFKHLCETEKIKLEPNFAGLRDTPLIALAHWNLTIGKMASFATRSHCIIQLVRTWDSSTMFHKYGVSMEIDNC